MALEPSAESGKIREQVLAVMRDAPNGMSPAEVYKAIYGNDPDPNSNEEKAAKQRVYYWLKALHKTKTFTQRGTSRGSTYFLAGRDRPQVSDLPTRRKYTPRGTAPATTTPSTNGMTDDNTRLIAFIVDDISEKCDRLKGLLH